MILVGQYDSPYVRRVAITLHHYGMPFERNPISVFADAGEMARINPLVRIPSLVLDGGDVLTDSGAIVDYLDDLAGPERALVPRAGEERWRVLQVLAVVTGTIDKVGAFVYEQHFHPPAHVNPDWLARLKAQTTGGMQWLERRLAGDWFFDRFTQADLTAGCLLGYLNLRLQELLREGRYPKLEALSKRCEALPAFIAARPSADEVMPAASAVAR